MCIELIPSCFPIYSNEHENGPLINCNVMKQYNSIHFENFILKNKEPDNCCSLLNGYIILIENIVLNMDQQFNIIGRRFMVLENFYEDPCSSSQLGIYHASSIGCLEMFSVNDIKHKCIKFPYRNNFVIFPLIHTF